MKCDNEDDDIGVNRQRYAPMKRLYSSTSPCLNASGASNVMSKKVKRSQFTVIERDEGKESDQGVISKSLLVYSRRKRTNDPNFVGEKSYFDRLVEIGEGNCLKDVNVEMVNEKEMDLAVFGKKRKRSLSCKMIGNENGFGRSVRRCGGLVRGSEVEEVVRVGKSNVAGEKKEAVSGSSKTKRWVELSFEGANPISFVGLQCKVFWPLDDDWYLGSINGYNAEGQEHQIQYKDGDAESLILSNERIKFYISFVDMQDLNLKYCTTDVEKKAYNYDEMLALAVSYDDCHDFEVGDIVWAKLSGYSMWPALVLDEARASAIGSLKPHMKEKTVPVQFFGTHEFARINIKRVKSFFRGLLSSLHLKCKQSRFERSLEEAKVYLSQQQLPNRMIDMQKGIEDEDCKNKDGRTANGGVSSCNGELQKRMINDNTCPLEFGDLCVNSLGKMVFDSEYFHNRHFIWPEGYTASRKFMSISKPRVNTIYKMEVLRNPKSKAHPLFRVTLDDGEQIEGPNPTACWKKIYSRIQRNTFKKSKTYVEGKLQKSGAFMFGFSNRKISQLIQNLPHCRSFSKNIEYSSNLPSGYRSVCVDWKDIDRCNVCHMDEEYEDNLFLQCDKCRMMVHARCYGEIEPLNGVLWFCNFCRPGAPDSPPPCCLCPVIGGAIKPTTDGRWAHLTCAMWIPETCLLDIKRMEPIDGIDKINKDRWKLLCSICGVSYGACIQCCNYNCCSAYHPLCARAADLCVELENEGQLHLLSVDENEEQCIRLVSYCKKHRQSSKEHSPSKEKTPEPFQETLACIPTTNPSGCARTEPYNFFGRRGQKEPQIFASASMKRIYRKNTPYLVSGCLQNGSVGSLANKYVQSITTNAVAKLKLHQCDAPCGISSMGEKYQYMKATCKKRLVFGKSQIHGFGLFTKIEHKAGDMVIEYAGEIVRPPIADIREHRIYNTLVGAGTYMFRMDNKRVVDATRAGSIAHLINHSCQPNCYSRTIAVHGDDHIIIFAKRDINQWEELTYDYRFFSKDEQLSCFCGSSKCRGVVNDVEAEQQLTSLWIPRCELTPWKED